MLYLTSKAGTGLVIAAGDQFQLLAKNSLGEPSLATPPIAAVNGIPAPSSTVPSPTHRGQALALLILEERKPCLVGFDPEGLIGGFAVFPSAEPRKNQVTA
jgi:hypothetical protein